MRRAALVALGATVALLAAALGGGPAGASAANPTATVATGGRGVPVIGGFTSFDPAVVGYQQSEFVLSGTANAYEPTAPLGPDGKFSVAPTTTAPYTTRVVVMRPIDPRRFNGTVIVEWLNVSGGADAGTDWMLAHNELVREGFAWVGVSAQKVGVDALKGTDPQRGDAARYAALSHPGDSFSYDIFSQGGQAVRDQADVILGALKPKQLVGVGESQSAGRLVTYIDAVHPLVHVYDGYLVHSRSAGGAALAQGPQPTVGVPSPTPIRDDLGVPVLVFQAENDVAGSNLNARQPDTDTYRLWEVAGTAHFDYYGIAIQRTDTGDGQGSVQILASMQSPPTQPSANFTCNSPINTGPAHYVLDAAFSSMHRWLTKDIAPSIAPRLQTTGVSPVVFATDANGNALGGIRTPAVDAPVAKLSGLGQGGNQFCFLFGTTVPFTAEQLAALYPNHGEFVSAWVKATNAARKAGFVVDADAKHLVAAASSSRTSVALGARCAGNSVLLECKANIRSRGEPMQDVLAGIRVVEVAAWTFVPISGAVLAEWGADVIKIEHPTTGDPQRGLVSSGLVPGGDGVNFMFELPNRGKRSVGLDISTESGRELLYRLVETADVFVTNHLPEVRERLGITVEQIRARNPNVIYVRGSGLGQRGPQTNRGGFDGATFWGRAGLAMAFKDPAAEWPPDQRPAFGDVLGGLTIAGGIAAALVRRERTGTPSIVDVSLLGMGMWALAPDITAAKLYEGIELPTFDRDSMPNPLVGTYPTKDGRYIILLLLQADRFWPDLCEHLDRPDLIDDPRFKDGASRYENRGECIQLLREIFRSRTYEEWVARLDTLKGVWAPLQTALELHDDPQAIANGYFEPIVASSGAEFVLPANPVQFDETPPSVGGAPEHGEHTDEVLLELGLTYDEIIEHKVTGAVL